VAKFQRSLDSVFPKDENDACDLTEPPMDLTPDEKAFVAGFGRLEVIENILADKGERKARRRRLRNHRHNPEAERPEDTGKS